MPLRGLGSSGLQLALFNFTDPYIKIVLQLACLFVYFLHERHVLLLSFAVYCELTTVLRKRSKANKCFLARTPVEADQRGRPPKRNEVYPNKLQTYTEKRRI